MTAALSSGGFTTISTLQLHLRGLRLVAMIAASAAKRYVIRLLTS
jgi:hypothetical protein